MSDALSAADDFDTLDDELEDCLCAINDELPEPVQEPELAPGMTPAWRLWRDARKPKYIELRALVMTNLPRMAVQANSPERWERMELRSGFKDALDAWLDTAEAQQRAEAAALLV